MNEHRRKDLAARIAKMAQYKSLAGATVLEIGADMWGYAAQMLVDAGAAKVVSTNYTDRWPNETNGPIEKRRADARSLAKSVPAESVDFVFGVAVLEHINGLADFFAGAREVLKPGGLFFVHGGPLWTFARGHHVFVNGEATKYRFSDNATNPIPNWAHLINDKRSLMEDLTRRGLPPGDVEKIGAWVYDLEDINRVGFRTMCETFEASDLRQVDRLIAAFGVPPRDLLAAIEAGPYGGQQRYDVSGVTFVAQA